MSQESWLQELFGSIDAMKTAVFVGFLAPGAVFRFGSAPAVTGRDAIAAAVDQFFASIAGVSHRLDKVFLQEGSIAVEGEVTYTRHDQSSVTLPFVDVFEMADKQVSSYRIYIDIGPLYAD